MFGGDDKIMEYINILYDGIGGQTQEKQAQRQKDLEASVKPKVPSMAERMAAAAKLHGFDGDD